MSDPFQPSTDAPKNGYDPHKIFTSSRDHFTPYASAKLPRISMPESLMFQIAALVSSQKIPAIRTNYDCVRNALYHGFHHMAEQYEHPVLDDIARQYSAMLEMEERQLRINREKSILDSCRQACLDAQTGGQRALVREMCDLARQALSYDPELVTEVTHIERLNNLGSS